MKIIEEFGQDIASNLISVAATIIVIVVIFIIANLVMKIAAHFTKKAMQDADKIKDQTKAQEVKTTATVAQSAYQYLVYIVSAVLILGVLGMSKSVSSAVVAAGVGGLVISFGAQSIIKDILAGAFILLEKQYFVGDYVGINEYEGYVTSMAIRVTYLDVKGKQVIIPNGSISEIVNYSRMNIVTFITVPTAYEANTRKVIGVLQKVADQFYEENKDKFACKPEVLGIENLNDSSVDLTLKITTMPLQHWQVSRDLKLAIKEEFDKKKISIPYQQIDIHKD